MNAEPKPLSPELTEILAQLKSITVAWSLEKQLDERRAAKLRRRAAVLLHDHYREHIPYYRKVCARMKVDGATDFETIAQKLLVPDDIFKSYPQRLLDEGDYARMNEWVSSIGTTKVSFDTSTIVDIDTWIERVEQHGVRLVFSSGTSGHVSFVPRDAETWASFTELPFLYVASSLGHRGVLPRWKLSVMKQLGKRLRPSSYTNIVRRYGLRSRDGFLFNFSGGNQGVQLAGQEIGKLTRRTHFLYEKKMSAAAVRAIVRGPRNEAERALVADFLDTTVKRRTKTTAG